MFAQRGLTLLELLFTIAIIIILVGIGSPVITSIQRNIQLKSVVENSYFALQYARSSAISQSANITVSFQKGKHWCLGISDLGQCQCSQFNQCTVNGVEQKIAFNDYPFIQLHNVTFGKNDLTIFDGIRGLTIGHAGSVTFSNDINQLKLILSNMGRARICGIGSTVGGYDKC